MELYTFTLFNKNYYFTDSLIKHVDIFNNITYMPIGIKRTEITQEFTEQDLRVTVPLNVEPFNLLACKPVNFLVQVKVEWNNTIFYGNLKSSNINISNNEIELIFGYYRFFNNGEIPSRNFGTSCSFTFCDSFCGLNKDNYSFTLTTDYANSNGIFYLYNAFSLGVHKSGIIAPMFGYSTLSYGDAVWNNLITNLSFDKYKTGTIETNYGEYSSISKITKSNDGEILFFHLSMPIVQTPLTINVSAGCDKSLLTCKTYNNSFNFGGFPFIPAKNPVTSGVL